ncbi:uncharacterized protein BJ171DRAFT_176680 [Polychytrium aggregatum]|uniref:uncharacterized protein n=1 Tax=Polychytrium aggregatum TaxID=110093 RepID=UPI0022FE2FE6|nr:uncharacterized protein BJ171DRAFT_176680 [Polychytrium aggregatum]KAI9202533.1 hypothetical protein BJ171DRAFT_176680 [Polychytrium aggregatum]
MCARHEPPPLRLSASHRAGIRSWLLLPGYNSRPLIHVTNYHSLFPSFFLSFFHSFFFFFPFHLTTRTSHDDFLVTARPLTTAAHPKPITPITFRSHLPDSRSIYSALLHFPNGWDPCPCCQARFSSGNARPWLAPNSSRKQSAIHSINNERRLQYPYPTSLPLFVVFFYPSFLLAPSMPPPFFIFILYSFISLCSLTFIYSI